MTLKDLFTKIDSRLITEDELVMGLKDLSPDEKQVAIKCYALMISRDKHESYIKFFPDFANKYPDIMKELKDGCSMTEEGKKARAKIYEDLIKDFKESNGHGKNT